MSTALRQAIERANQMPTTLWFSNDEQLDDLITCGRVTIAHRLLAHYLKAEPEHPLRDKLVTLLRRENQINVD